MKDFPYDAVLFDLDGTLCNAEQGIVGSFEYAMKTMDFPVPEGFDMRLIIGPPLKESFVKLMGMPADKVDEAADIYREHFMREGLARYTVYPNIRTILRILHEGGVYTALATSKPRNIAMQVLERFGLTRYFDKIVGEQDDDTLLNKPGLVQKALPERYTRAAMVGDRFYDMVGASANQIEAIGVGYGFGTVEELRDAGAAHIAPDTAALQALLCRDAAVPRGFFLTVEGLDGSGKTTQVELLEKNLRDYGFDVLRTREPGGCKISEDIRRIILDTDNLEMCATCEALLYAAARAQHVHQVIRPGVERGKLVLCDRFADSSIAYQGGGRELGLPTVQQINAPAVADMVPDATVYLKIDHREGLKRRYSASEPDRLELEGSAFYERVEKAYEKLICDHPQRFLLVDASQDVETVAGDALAIVLSKLEPDIKREG